MPSLRQRLWLYRWDWSPLVLGALALAVVGVHNRSGWLALAMASLLVLAARMYGYRLDRDRLVAEWADERAARQWDRDLLRSAQADRSELSGEVHELKRQILEVTAEKLAAQRERDRLAVDIGLDERTLSGALADDARTAEEWSP